MMEQRQLKEHEIPLVWTIDRRELIERIYYHEGGALILRDERYDMGGWPPGEAESATPKLMDCFARGGWFHGVFDGGALVAAAVVDSKFLGRGGRKLQLSFLHVGRDQRGHGLGRELFDLAKAEARRRGASHLYVSATPSESTVGFYGAQGCVLCSEVDAELFELEPLDIHFEYPL
ncbi:MAG: GNAT family N-acetyltransferase [Planctomycetota bacterium]|nr:GNAT family N-acetyltransferase [Planctomycetota bacterium]